MKLPYKKGAPWSGLERPFLVNAITYQLKDMKNPRMLLLIGTLLMALSVALGAFGAHALKARLTASGRLETYELGIRYMMFHALGLILLGILVDRYPALHTAGILLLVGVFFFSGSLLALSLTNTPGWGAVAPIGGTALIAGWLFAAWTIFQSKAG